MHISSLRACTIIVKVNLKFEPDELSWVLLLTVKYTEF